MPEFQFQEMFPQRRGHHVLPQALLRLRRHDQVQRPDVLTVEPEALTMLTAAAFHDISHLLRPGHLAQLRSILDDGEASRQRQVRGARAPEERQHRGRRRAADVPGHRHRHRHGQEGPGGVDRRRRRGRDRQGRATRPTPRPTCAIRRSRRSRCSRKCRPAPTCRRRSTSMRPTAMPTSSCSSPRAAARPTRAISTSRRRRC